MSECLIYQIKQGKTTVRPSFDGLYGYLPVLRRLADSMVRSQSRSD